MLIITIVIVRVIIPHLVFIRKIEEINLLVIINVYLREPIYSLKLELTRKDPRKDGYLRLDLM